MEDASILRALTEKYADILGEIRDHEHKAETLKVDLHHVEHVIRLYRKEWSGEAVKPRRPSYPSRYLKVGTGSTTALDILREAGKPMSVREIVHAVMARLEIDPTSQAVHSLDSSLRYCLEKRVGDGLEIVSDKPKRFAIAS